MSSRVKRYIFSCFTPCNISFVVTTTSHHNQNLYIKKTNPLNDENPQSIELTPLVQLVQEAAGPAAGNQIRTFAN